MRPQGFQGQQDTSQIAVVATRRTLARAMSALGAASDAQVARCYRQLVAAVEQAFRAEELVTEQCGQCALHEQRERYARALSALHQASPRIEQGDIALAREALELLSRFLAMQPVRYAAPPAASLPRPLRRRAHRPRRHASERRQLPRLLEA